MSLYSYLGSEPKLYAEKESGLNILWKEVLWSDTYGKFFE
jgi:hypothetical protein